MPSQPSEAFHAALDLTPDRLARVVGQLDEPALLESGPGFGAAGRWCIYAAEPRLVFTVRDERCWVSTDRPLIPGSRSWSPVPGPPLDALARLVREHLGDVHSDPPGPDHPPFRGGFIGFLGFDLAPQLERLPRRARPVDRVAAPPAPDVHLALYDTFVTFDRTLGQATLTSCSTRPDDATDRISRWLQLLSSEPPSLHPLELTTPIRSHVARSEYLTTVERAIEYIRAGDIFQVNLAQRFEAVAAGDPLEFYLRLRHLSPAPFAAFLRSGDLTLVSASPEWFYQTRGDRIVTRPIKGTRPRGATPFEDARLHAELRASPKDRAELTMIVDLERNDLGRVCRYGTVRVIDPLAVESYAQVHHLVATVEGTLRPGTGPVDVLRAMFPGGSITGAPKIRAMEIIDELEPVVRGPYTGAIGYFSRGASAFNIAIRTVVGTGEHYSYHVGGGIVADSVPELEFDETLHKGRGLRAALEGAGR